MLDYTMKRLDGQEENLKDYQGKVLLLVNVASECGLTPQYRELQALYAEYKDQGLEVLGFPANNFGAQEPGTDQQISQFCERNYGVTFPMFSKISVKGADKHPLYDELTSMPAPIGGEVEWNFQKYLVDRHGDVVARFAPPTTPNDPKLVGKIEELLAEK